MQPKRLSKIITADVEKIDAAELERLAVPQGVLAAAP
jgi:hypothetical protein